ncbi:putative nonsense-mediated mRNA decay factor [Sphaerosporella brunnea]|uniref:Putative nonsense-mediated mRNA decay factor n=1 Tax=Sphaerosporella brunnea TaxID=1250544 RepID=A0A5J5EMD2_9PEZI|nr:putative nonsense-mediated mRNA decay factor [Sphaerosporella brunnea]
MTSQISRARKRELQALNQAAWGGKEVFKNSGSLDSSLKKNTALIKRLRTSLTSESQSALLKDIQTTSLEKYLPEAISAVAEGLPKSKIADIGAVIEVISALHQRFQREFTPKLTFALAKGLTSPRADVLKGLSPEQREREEKERLARQRALLRIGIELWLVGVVRSVQDAEDASLKAANPKTSAPTPTKKDASEAEPFPLEVLKELLGRDREHINLPLVVLFVKQFAYDLLGVKARSSSRKTVEEDGATNAAIPDTDGKPKEEGALERSDVDSSDPPLVPPELQQRFRNILTRYLDSVKSHIVRDHERLQQQSARNADAYIKSGEIFEDRQSNYEKAIKIQEKLITNAQTVADILGVDMPDLPDDRNDDGAKDTIIREGGSMFAAKGEEGRSGIWEDEDQRRFYEELIDLKGRVPAILLEDGKKKKKDGETKAEDEIKHTEDEDKDNTLEEHQDTANIEPDTEKKTAEEAASMVIVNKTIGAQVDALLLRLPDLNNRDMIDQAAIDFCFLNSKASRNRLIRVLQDVPRNRQDLLPTYSRLAATLNKYLPDIGKALVEHLDKEFRSLQRRKEKDLSESRARNARYLSELTKFGVVPEHVIFHCLKVALEDFHRTNIEIICHILETCGRYLLRTPDTGPRMAGFLETLKKKKDGVHHLGHQERITIENAFYYVNPPERPAITQKERSIMELFVRKLIYLDLTKRNYVKILKQLRKLHWEDPTIVNMLKKVFTKIWKVRYNNIHILAIIVGALSRYHQDFAYGVIDEILEQISVGLEENNFKHNQRRIAQVKYLGELYNYKMVDSPVIFDALYRIITFGHEGGMPKPGIICLLDPPDDFFRIRLACSLLDVCGACFDRGSAKKMLDFFLAFLQYYYHTKESAPMDIDFLLQDTLAALRPTWKMHGTLDEAGKAFEEAVAKTYKQTEIDHETAAAQEEEEAEDESESDEGDGEDMDLRDEEVEAEGAVSDGEEAEEGEEGTVATGPHTDPSLPSSDEDDEDIVVTREQQLDPEYEADFDREFAKMMSESLESRKFDRKPVFDVPLPIRKATSALSRENTMESESGDLEQENTGTMMFSLLTKRGNRQQTKMVALPSDSGFALAMKDKREKEREEKQKIKELVMSYDMLDETSELDALDKHATLNGYHIKVDNNKSSRNQPRSRKLSMSDVNWT